jgi:hypothetical protein
MRVFGFMAGKGNGIRHASPEYCANTLFRKRIVRRPARIAILRP